MPTLLVGIPAFIVGIHQLKDEYFPPFIVIFF
jgi:hypothetical protein